MTHAARHAPAVSGPHMTDIVLLLVLILINGVFAMSEIALISSRKARLQQLADARHPGAAQALRLSADPTHFLSTVQVGITLVWRASARTLPNPGRTLSNAAQGRTPWDPATRTLSHR